MGKGEANLVIKMAGWLLKFFLHDVFICVHPGRTHREGCNIIYVNSPAENAYAGSNQEISDTPQLRPLYKIIVLYASKLSSH